MTKIDDPSGFDRETYRPAISLLIDMATGAGLAFLVFAILEVTGLLRAIFEMPLQ